MMVVAVTTVAKHTREQFEASIPAFKANVEKNSPEQPKYQTGQTDAGNPYILATLKEEGTKDIESLYVVTAAVWIADKGITVTTIFEGQGKMKSRTFQSADTAEFESTAKAICLSPR
jgi:hypothetical protein